MQSGATGEATRRGDGVAAVFEPPEVVERLIELGEQERRRRRAIAHDAFEVPIQLDFEPGRVFTVLPALIDPVPQRCEESLEIRRRLVRRVWMLLVDHAPNVPEHAQSRPYGACASGGREDEAKRGIRAAGPRERSSRAERSEAPAQVVVNNRATAEPTGGRRSASDQEAGRRSASDQYSRPNGQISRGVEAAETGRRCSGERVAECEHPAVGGEYEVAADQ